MLGRELAAAGLVVVSGLARGIDGEVHRGVLEAGGLTVGVLGCGIDRDYPASNAQLSRRIEEQGLVVSEYEAGVEPAPWRFPARNRIIAGLSEAVAVVEARERSGALITADFALEEGREVFAVPGEITSGLSAGTNALLKLGATPLTAVDDVLDALGVERMPPGGSAELSPAAARVLELVRDSPGGADELTARGVLEPGALSVALTELELAGIVAVTDGVYRAVSAR
jgi:DNA processing protein